jgi:hypothetical protein
MIHHEDMGSIFGNNSIPKVSDKPTSTSQKRKPKKEVAQKESVTVSKIKDWYTQ